MELLWIPNAPYDNVWMSILSHQLSPLFLIMSCNPFPKILNTPLGYPHPWEKKICANCATSRKQNTPSFTAGKVKTIYFKVNPIIKQIFVQSHLSSYQRSQYKGYPLPRFDQFIHIHFPIHCNKSPKSTEQKQ